MSFRKIYNQQYYFNHNLNLLELFHSYIHIYYLIIDIKNTPKKPSIELGAQINVKEIVKILEELIINKSNKVQDTLYQVIDITEKINQRANLQSEQIKFLKEKTNGLQQKIQDAQKRLNLRIQVVQERLDNIKTTVNQIKGEIKEMRNQMDRKFDKLFKLFNLYNDQKIKKEE